METSPIYIVDKSEDDGLRELLGHHLCPQLDRTSKSWERALLESSPLLAPYLIHGTAKAFPESPGAVRVYAPTSRTATLPRLGSQWEVLLRDVTVPLSIVCAAGGARALIDLLRVWVEERKGRCITFKYKDIEITLKGGVSTEDVERIVRLFEERFAPSKIVRPE